MKLQITLPAFIPNRTYAYNANGKKVGHVLGRAGPTITAIANGRVQGEMYFGQKFDVVHTKYGFKVGGCGGVSYYFADVGKDIVSNEVAVKQLQEMQK